MQALELVGHEAAALGEVQQLLGTFLSGAARGPLRGGMGAVAATLLEAVR